MEFAFKDKNPRNLTKCVKCGNEYSMGRSVKGKDGTTKAWVHDTRCPECGTANDDGIKKVFGKARGEQDENSED